MMGKRQKTIGIALAVVACLVAVLWMMTRRGGGVENASESTERPVKVAAIVVTSRPIADEASASGTIRPLQDAQLAAKIMSTVTEVYVKEGDHVRKGQVLVRLEARDLSTQVSSASAAVNSAQSMSRKAQAAIELQAAQTSASIASAQATLEMARQQLSSAKEGPRKQEKTQADLAVVQAEAQYNHAQTELGRMTRLYEQDVIPKQRLDSTQTQFEVAKAQLGIARQQAEMSREGGRSQDVQAAQERVRQAEEALRLAKASAVQNKMAKRDAQASAAMVSQARAGESAARVQLGYATIVAPFSGVVAARFVDKGDMVSPSVPVMMIEDDSLYRLEATVAARDIGVVFKGMTVGLELGTAKRLGRGRVSVLSPSGDPASRKFLVKVDIPDSMPALTGDFGRMSFARGHTQGVVCLRPQSTMRAAS